MSRSGRMLLLALGAVLLVTGCAKKTPVEVTDLLSSIDTARKECASVYAADELAALQSDVDGMNALVDDGKMKKARKAAEPLRSEVQSLRTRTESRRSEAKRDAEAAIAAAEKELAAAREAGAAEHASREYGTARGRLEEARAKVGDPCGYLEAAKLAGEASDAARRASAAAVAEKERLEEERRRREEEERRRREEEERRRREEELRRRPPTWVVERGDHLWGISGKDRIYGNPTLWPLIYDANRDKISDPDLIYPGQQLTIPRGMSDAQMRSRLAELWMELSQ